jgi:hypothetical protein
MPKTLSLFEKFEKFQRSKINNELEKCTEEKAYCMPMMTKVGCMECFKKYEDKELKNE